jgi:pimeloyl-ACP methyl ester carboxylesterase
MTDSQDAAFPAFIEHRVPRGRGSLYVRDFPGSGPAFVVLHGFPDNSHIYDDLIPHLVSAGRSTVAMDFLGFGASDKPEDALYSFEQQLGDLEAVVETLRLEEIIPVGHDAGGPTAVNFALKHPDRTAAVTLMNALAAVKKKDSYLQAQFYRIKARRGPKKAIMAVAASILTAIYHMLKDGTMYHDLGRDHFDRRSTDQQKKSLVKRLADLGYAVEIKPLATTA